MIPGNLFLYLENEDNIPIRYYIIYRYYSIPVRIPIRFLTVLNVKTCKKKSFAH